MSFLNKRNLRLECFRIIPTIELMTKALFFRFKILFFIIKDHYFLYFFPTYSRQPLPFGVFLSPRKRKPQWGDWVSDGSLIFLQSPGSFVLCLKPNSKNKTNTNQRSPPLPFPSVSHWFAFISGSSLGTFIPAIYAWLLTPLYFLLVPSQKRVWSQFFLLGSPSLTIHPPPILRHIPAPFPPSSGYPSHTP